MISRVVAPDHPLSAQALGHLRHDVYHLPEYISVESRRTKTTPEAFVIIDGDRIVFVPYLLRRCGDILTEDAAAGEVADVVSPYGYSGILLSPAVLQAPGFPAFALDELTRILKAKGVCSGFFRLHPILNETFAEIFEPGTFVPHGETVSVDLTLSKSQLWAHTRKGHQSAINKCKRLGFTARMAPIAQSLDEFIAVYQETMDRVGAPRSYYFSRDYFTQLLTLGDRLHLCLVEWDGRVAAASLFFECCGIVQAHLGGSRTEFLSQSPFSLLLDYVRLWAKERGNEFLHLGGGVGGYKDSLYAFKSGFSRRRHSFLTLRLIMDEAKYRYLVGLRARALNAEAEDLLKSDFFPAYRYPSPEDNGQGYGPRGIGAHSER
jgi:hypothetical protein